MVDPLSAALTGITLVTTVADKIKQGLDAYKSVAELGDQIESLFEGEKQLQRARNKKAGQADPFSTRSIAKEVMEVLKVALNCIIIEGYGLTETSGGGTLAF